MSQTAPITRVIALGAFSGVLLDLPFPLAGPMPPWRGVVAFVALVPLLSVLFEPLHVEHRKYVRRAVLAGYVCGVLWYLLNSYWIYDTMHIYGGLPGPVAALILLGYALILGNYFAIFAWLVAVARQGSGRALPALVLTPVLYVAVEYLTTHLTNVPWDLLGYAQVDNQLLNQLAPWTGQYGLTLVIVAVNCVFVGAWLGRTPRRRLRFVAGGIVLMCALELGIFLQPKPAPVTARAVLLEENLKVGSNMRDENNWTGVEWDLHTGEFLRLSRDTCTPYLLGMPEPAPETVTRVCPHGAPPAAIVAWPEAPAPFEEEDPRFIALMRRLTAETGATAIVGNVAEDAAGNYYNAGTVTGPSGVSQGHYAKIHLVPFGEYVPFKDWLAFAGHLTRNVSSLTPGTERKVFLIDGHRVSIFICYEAVFDSEIRLFAKAGAELFVNISDDGWYDDTSAPWQHLNQARMRAIENRRWILRDTNTGVTAAIDPDGRVTESMPRHVLGALAADYGYRSDVTFYSRYGDVFAQLCGIIAIASTAFSLRKTARKSAA
jgi:apolipoprotein N-acyltransferase